jgi:shikimate dehydrogenase
MKKYSLIGYPLGHTMSPPIHNRLLQLSGIEGSYEVMEIHPDDLKNHYSVLSTLDGFNITIPHKVSIINFTDELDEKAALYGAVNCVKIQNGKKIGYNTDVVGFTRSIEQMGASLSDKVLLLGCGGVGRMMAIETVLQNGSLTIAVREADLQAANELKNDILKLKPNAVVEITTLGNIQGSYDLLVNATPVGMHPNNDDIPIHDSVLSNVKFVFDAIYNPRETRLLKTAKNYGATVLGGMSMLVLQAVRAHEIWNGVTFDKKDIDTLITDMEKLI